MNGGGLDIAGSAGRIEALRRDPPGGTTPRWVAVICHPHPLYGGTMHGKLVHRVAKACAIAGAVAWRFQFRGVGRSGGEHDHGQGELDDVAAVVDHAATLAPTLPIAVLGYSFGAWVGMRHGASDPRVAAMVGIGLAITLHDFTMVASSDKPKTVIQGDSDKFGPLAAVAAEIEGWRLPKRLIPIEGADHFFTEALDRVADRAASSASVIAG